MKKAVITGHSKGLGKALAMTLIEQGFDILGLSRSACEEINGLQQVPLDLSDPAALVQWADSGAVTAVSRWCRPGHSRQQLGHHRTGQPAWPAGQQGNHLKR